MSVWNILDQLINSILRTREKANRPYGGKSNWEQEIVSGLARKGVVKHLSPHSGNH